MATNKYYIILLQLIIFVFDKTNSQALPTVPCQPVLTNYFDYLSMPNPIGDRWLLFQATSILQNRYVAYYKGTLVYVASIDSLQGTVTVSFSDRTGASPCGSWICSPNQNFYYKKTDTQTIGISRLGVIQYTLNSWGNWTYTEQLQCYGVDKPFYTAPTAQSSSMFVMTLQKYEYIITK